MQRIDCKDVLGVYSCASWQPEAQIPVVTQDLADLAWSPDGACIAAWDSPLYSHQVAVYTPEGDCLVAYSAYKGPLGIQSMAWSPSGQLLALGSFDQEVRVLNHVTWSPLAQFSHPVLVRGPATVVAYMEELEDSSGQRLLATDASWQQQGQRPLSRVGSRLGSPLKPGQAGSDVSLRDLDDEAEPADFKSRYVVAELPLRVPQARPSAAVDKGVARHGIGAQRHPWLCVGGGLILLRDTGLAGLRLGGGGRPACLLCCRC